MSALEHSLRKIGYILAWRPDICYVQHVAEKFEASRQELVIFPHKGGRPGRKLSCLGIHTPHLASPRSAGRKFLG